MYEEKDEVLPYSDVYSEIEDQSLCCETEGEAGIHDEHAGFDCVDDIEHCLSLCQQCIHSLQS
jgi:hypothetical protein